MLVEVQSKIKFTQIRFHILSMIKDVIEDVATVNFPKIFMCDARKKGENKTN